MLILFMGVSTVIKAKNLGYWSLGLFGGIYRLNKLSLLFNEFRKLSSYHLLYPTVETTYYITSYFIHRELMKMEKVKRME